MFILYKSDILSFLFTKIAFSIKPFIPTTVNHNWYNSGFNIIVRKTTS